MQSLELLPVTEAELTPGTHNPQFIIALNKRLNAQSERITAMLQEIEETNEHPIGYADIMHWKARATYLRNVGQAKKAAAIEKAEALRAAKEADEDEEFMEGYKSFLETEFTNESIEEIS